jgi:hypothetical protein
VGKLAAALMALTALVLPAAAQQFNSLPIPTIPVSQLPAATTPLTGTELFYVVQGGVSKSVIFSQLQQSITMIPGLPNLTTNVEGTGTSGLDGANWFIWNLIASSSLPTLRVDRHVTGAGGIFGDTVSAIWANSSNNSADRWFEWTLLGEQMNFAGAYTGAQNVASNGTIFKQPIATTYPTATASGDGTTATITFTASPSITYVVGETITVAGVTPSGYNGTFKITGSSANSISYANATTGAQTVAGTVLEVSVGPSWGGNFNCTDNTTEADPIASCIGVEIDVHASAATTDANRQRVGAQIAVSGPSGSHVGYGLLMGPSGGVVIDTAISINDSSAPTFQVFGNGAAQIGSNLGNWGNANVGKQLIVTPETNAAVNPAIGISDSNSTNFIAMENATGVLLIEGMPALTNSTTAPVVFAEFSATGAQLLTLPTSAGGGGLNVCVDTAGNLYKKSACP